VKSILHAIAVLSVSSSLSMFVGLLTFKVLAVVLGPVGFGFFGLLQNLIALWEMIGSMGIGVALVRSGASALADGNSAELAHLKKAAIALFMVLGGPTAIVLITFREEVGYWMLGGVEYAVCVVLLTAAVLFRICTNFQIGFLNAIHRVSVMARANILESLLVSMIYIVSVYLFEMDAVVPMLIVAAAVSALISRHYLLREMPPCAEPSPVELVKQSAKTLLSIGCPYTASLIVGAGVQLLLPAMVMHVLTPLSVGQYRAAVSISVACSSFLIASISKDYYPRVSAASNNPAMLALIVNYQLSAMLLLGSPIILTGITVAPYAIPLLFSPDFGPAAEVLEWQMIGEIFRLSSWTMSFVILVRCSGTVYFLIELLAGITMFSTSWLCLEFWGLRGLGISFLITYILYNILVLLVVRHDIKLIVTSLNKKILLLTVASAVTIPLTSWTRVSEYKIYIAMSLTAIVTASCICALRRNLLQMRTNMIDR
jgi:enterobacterial common antigen flippase